MEPFHDIYRKDEPPFLRRRKKTRPEKEEPPPAAKTEFGKPKGSSSGHSSNFYRSRHRWSRRTSLDTNRNSRRLWILLSLVFAIYAGFLAYTLLKGARKPDTASRPVEQETPTTESPAVTPEAATEAARYIRERIATWSRIPDAIVQAQTLFERGHPDQAEERLLRAMESTPNSVRLQTRLAQIHIEQKNHARAMPLLLDALEANPDDHAIRLMLGSVYESQTNHAAVLAVANWILETDPHSSVAHQMAANAYLNTDRKASAIQHLRRVTQMDRDNVVAQNKLGVAYADLGEHVKAIQVFNEILARNRMDSTTYYNLAASYARQGMADQSAEVLSRAMALFGEKFVASWVRNPEFDSIRNNRVFSALVSDATPTVTETGAPAAAAIVKPD